MLGWLKGALGPAANDSRFLLDVDRRDLPGEASMRRYADDEEVDLCIVGAGAGGSVLATDGSPARDGALSSSKPDRSGIQMRTG